MTLRSAIVPIASLLLWGCQNLVFGVPLDLWDGMSESERFAAYAAAEAERLEEERRLVELYEHEDVYVPPYWSFFDIYTPSHDDQRANVSSAAGSGATSPSVAAPQRQAGGDLRRAGRREERPVPKGKGREPVDEAFEAEGPRN